MTSNKNILDKLDIFFENEYKTTSHISIFQNSDGSYEMFQKYIIRKVDSLYKVIKLSTYVELEFSVLQNAVAWCIFDHRNKIIDCNKMISLDKEVASINANILLLKTLIQRTKDKDNKLLYYAKMSNDLWKKKNCSYQLQKLLKDATAWQINRFATKA